MENSFTKNRVLIGPTLTWGLDIFCRFDIIVIEIEKYIKKGTKFRICYHFFIEFPRFLSNFE
ncbi:MAG: hypothetical protein A3G49_05715 [Candidatus Sungbacteria bacterium RIFCSPLOWO2_12_FULL_41_11]|uniref:Uncharacterized protein n=1 Tax=Candidatus Sungbacteria bacterium RIFCSPLOWO2_12_FULL_41_11 TaxID=1802286 RepID=A0A1G2LSM6_9BACT|nr:MAG: hypothetical protein A3G49_05715 [Candidatus Sungbacteria bacterium RIFCSPLOWO2_12_FULL_41_11]